MDDVDYIDDKVSILQISCITSLTANAMLANDTAAAIEASLGPSNHIMSMVCPGDCLEKGLCSDGKCLCDEGT